MSLYQLVKVCEDNSLSYSKSIKSLKRQKTRLSKLNRGWIVELQPDMSKKVVACRGFSKQMQEAVQSFNVVSL